jgi:hypothetical protein
MIDVLPLLLAPRDKFVTLNIFGRKFSVDFLAREDWSTECVDLIAPDELLFITDRSLCEGRAGAILNVRESYALGSNATVFQSKVYAFLPYSEYYIIFRRALSTDQYQSALIVGLLSWLLNHMPCLPELYYSVEILFRNWFWGPWKLWCP